MQAMFKLSIWQKFMLLGNINTIKSDELNGAILLPNNA